MALVIAAKVIGSVTAGLDTKVHRGFHETRHSLLCPTKHMTEAELRIVVERVIAGDHQAYAAIVRSLTAQGWSLARRMMPTRQDAEDALQDAFVKCYRSLPRFTGQSQLGTWFFRIVYTTCINHLRKRAKHDEYIEVKDNVDVADIDDVDDGQETIERLSSEVLLQALDSLPVRYRSALTMFYVNNLSHQEIHEVTGLPIGTIKTNLHRGRNLLRQSVSTKTPSTTSAAPQSQPHHHHD